MTSPTPSEERDGLVEWLQEAARYFEKRDIKGEDRAFWANVYSAATCRKIAAKLKTDAAEIIRLRAEVARLSKPEWFWDCDGDGDGGVADWADLVTDGPDLMDVVEIGSAVSLPKKWGATRCLTVDKEGDPDETKPVLFDTEAEARTCWPDSLAAARTARELAE